MRTREGAAVGPTETSGNGVREPSGQAWALPHAAGLNRPAGEALAAQSCMAVVH